MKKIAELARVRTRFAPSPTGFMHLGALRTALFSYAFAKKHGGDFILRIEDTDQKRTVPGSFEQIIKTLNWAHLPHDELYVQSDRFDIYKKYANILLEKKHAYKCYCTSDRLSNIKSDGDAIGSGSKYDRYCLSLTREEIADFESKNTPFVIRMKIPDGNAISFEDQVYGKVSFKNETVDDQVLIKSDGFPTYHLANVVDDYEMKISHVIRGCEWISSTPKHVLLYEMFGWNPPMFAHLPLLVNDDGSKLSKRQGHSNLDWYRDKGFLPEALVNFVAQLGWASGDAEDIYTLDQIVEKFSLERVNKGNCMVGLKKLEWINSQHIRRKIENELGSVVIMVRSYVPHDVDDQYIGQVLHACKDRIWNLDEFYNQFYYFFVDIDYKSENSIQLGEKVKKGQHLDKIRLFFENELGELPEFTENEVNDVINRAKTELNSKYADIVSVLRYALTGQQNGPGINQTITTLGKKRVLQRLQDLKTRMTC